ncbi:MAG: L,D-transpeptidase [Anaerotruncus sp.]|nr:MAG: L,D-transpeptidase [Anaerotruncus sp.]
MVCSVGKEGNTPSGTFKTSDKYTWRLLEGNVYGQYATRITGHILFHSVPYFEKSKDTLEYDEYNKLGVPASAGCIRLSVADAKWIYDNCPTKTTVEMYDSDKKEPLAKPSAIKIDTSDTVKRNWDPTDPDKKITHGIIKRRGGANRLKYITQSKSQINKKKRSARIISERFFCATFDCLFFCL